MFRRTSPLYERLSVGVSHDREVLELAALAPKNQAMPTLFFAVVHYLLLKGNRHELASYYPDLSGSARGGDPFPTFKSFCREYRSEIGELVSTRAVQANAVGRSAFLAPVFNVVADPGRALPVAMIEVGASAGLNLLWDKYGYDYDGHRCGDLNSAVQLRCRLRGRCNPPVSEPLPWVAFRLGLDLAPVDLDDPDEVLWLKSFVAPEQSAKASLLQSAIELARESKPEVVPGDAVETLPKAVQRAPPDSVLCVLNVHALRQFRKEAIQALDSVLLRSSAERPIYSISIEPDRESGASSIQLASYREGARVARRLGYCADHDDSLTWLCP